MNEHEQLSSRIYNDSCLTCTILEINQILNTSCQKSLTCIKLFFDHNLIFEEFLKKYGYIIENLYINDRDDIRNSILVVYIKHHNLTEIDFDYLNSIFNIRSPPYNMLNIVFNRSEQELKILRIIDNFSLMNNSNITITIPCNTSNQTIDYRIQSGKMTSIKSMTCELSQSNNLSMSLVNINLTTMITLHTSTNPTTSFRTQLGSSFPYLILVFFVITMYVIIACTWSFIRKNIYHDIDDERLTLDRKIINTDKYGITDKDSKSAASWSHKSALLLSPLVK